MKNTVFAAFMAISSVAALSACTTTEKGAVGGAVAGALIGQAVGGNTQSTLIGAGVGAVAGAAAGEIVGRQANGNCVYQKANGQQYLARCPS